MPFTARLFIFFIGIGFFLVVLELVRKKRFREELSVIWLFFALSIALSSVLDKIIDPLAKILHISYPPAFAFMLISIVMIISLLYFSLVTSDLKSRVKELTQKIALLEFESKSLRKNKE
jgi:ABC-type anion transport system duplicated permease subunit